jgi:hypothetical protein
MGEFDLNKLVDELFKPTDPPKETALKNTDETPSTISPESILPPLPPEGQAWLNGLIAHHAGFRSWSIGNIFAIPYKNSNATSGLPIAGSSLSHQKCPPAASRRLGPDLLRKS